MLFKYMIDSFRRHFAEAVHFNKISLFLVFIVEAIIFYTFIFEIHSIFGPQCSCTVLRIS